MTQDQITEMQRYLRPRRWHPPMLLVPHAHWRGRPVDARAELRRRARWWELEAMRGYDWAVDEYGMNSSDRSKMYASNLRWCVELMDAGVDVSGRFDRLVATHARMTWDEFIRRHAERICGDMCTAKRSKGHR